MNRAVIDQPGLRVFFTGVLLALILGLACRAQISSARINSLLSKSIQVLEKDFLIKYENAEVRLSKWALPLPHLVVDKIYVSSKKTGCENSQIFIDELEIPISFSQIFLQDKGVELVRAKNVDFRINQLNECFDFKRKDDKANSEATASREGTGATESLKSSQSENIFTQSNHDSLKEIYIEQLKVISAENYEQPFLLKQFRIDIDYENTIASEIKLKSKLYTLKDKRTGIYFLTTDLEASIKPDVQKNILINLLLKGRLLDGDINVFMNASGLKKSVNIEVTTNKVSLKAFAPLFANSKFEAINSLPMNLSFNLLGEYQISDAFGTFKFKNINVNGDNMSILSPEINIESKKNIISYSPFQLKIDHVTLAPLKQILAGQINFQSIEDLGVLSGLYEFTNPHSWNFEGSLEKTSLIFSNRGSRELQIVDSLELTLKHIEKEYQLNFDQIKMNQQDIAGTFEGRYSTTSKDLIFKINLDGPILNEKIWQQITEIKQMPELKLSWNYKKSLEERHQLKLVAQQLSFPGLQLSDVQVDYLNINTQETKSLAMMLKSSKAELNSAELNPVVVSLFFNSKTELQAPQYHIFKPQISIQGDSWKNFNFDFESTLVEVPESKQISQLRGKGDLRGEQLSGVIQLQNTNQLLKFDLVKNDKDEMILIKENKN